MSSYDTYGLCKCGYFQRTFGGSRFFWPDVCPSCGEFTGRRLYDNGAWRMVTGRERGLFRRRLEAKEY